jgi:hypothetical protein
MRTVNEVIDLECEAIIIMERSLPPFSPGASEEEKQARWNVTKRKINLADLMIEAWKCKKTIMFQGEILLVEEKECEKK